METIRTIGRAAHDFGRSVVEWRSPASGPYLMAVNSAFWALAVYGDPVLQCRCLITLAAGVVGWDTLLSPSRDRSTLLHIVMWPVANLWRTAGVGLSLYGVHQIKAEEVDIAWKVAYSSLGCLLVNPVWQHHQVNAKICRVSNAAFEKTKAAVDYVIVQPTLTVYRAVKYVVLLEFLPPLIAYVKRKLVAARDAVYARCRAIKEWWRGWIMLPIKDKLFSIGRFFRYWLCAEWWPVVREAIGRKWTQIKERSKRVFNYVCYWTIYVVCGHWVKPCARYTRDQLKELGVYLHRTLWTPFKIWFLAQLRTVVDLLKRAAKALALAIRDSILWPIGILLADLIYQLGKMFYDAAIHPLLLILYDKYKIVEDYALIYVLGPTCEKIVNNIPEKSPFCDESDVELEGLLPAQIDEEAEKESDGERDRDSALEDDDYFLPHDAPLDYDESEFATGLAFPTVDASESSDEEFDLHRRRGEEQKSDTQRRRERKAESSKIVEEGPERETPNPPPRRRKKDDPDDTFEILQ
ncbi:hypothetical protein PFISCL1PPCAC_9925 [Pristionchus fissidentatus]|uniref:Uncharacterized protein n=1 Tax=Pristionchus fissidentatus TaxID=1538716 RepID=A0AAV5VK17_9BILA|nr:hypothetical protein PFISCL1PPCAC_9925 [Pristionchus fissidentatus]